MQQDTPPTPEPTPDGSAAYNPGDALREMFRLRLAWEKSQASVIIWSLGLVIAILIGFIMVLLALLFSVSRLAAAVC